IQLSWSHSDLPTNSSKILHYELFVNIPQREPISDACIKKIQPLRLPMACTLNCIELNDDFKKSSIKVKYMDLKFNLRLA
uniref:Leptin receptor n=1 Tax=Romanomermis culicivorax TaxID=13658 RepID=A0A915IPL6_ROMCU